MSRHIIIIAACILLSLGMCAGVFVQQRQLNELSILQQQFVCLLQPRKTVQPPDFSPSFSSPSPELLRLRGRITQLAERKRALADVRAENERLRVAMEDRKANATNNTSSPTLPPGYIRKSEAQWVGLGSPENTLQSFLWAVRNHDLTNFIHTLTPETAARILRDNNGSVENFFESSDVLPGMALTTQEAQSDGSIKAKIEVVPGESMGNETIKFRLIQGEWKMGIMDPN